RQAATERARLRGLVLIASQATAAARSWRTRWLIGAAMQLLALRRRAPGHHFGLGSEPESAELMRQWCRWSLSGRFLGADGFDYMEALGQVRIPVLAIAAGADRFIAPQA